MLNDYYLAVTVYWNNKHIVHIEYIHYYLPQIYVAKFYKFSDNFIAIHDCFGVLFPHTRCIHWWILLICHFATSFDFWSNFWFVM